MEQLIIRDYLYIKSAVDKMSDELHCTEAYDDGIDIDKSTFITFLEEFNVKHGIKAETIRLLLNMEITKDDFPILIAEGNYAEHGDDAYIEFNLKLNTRIDKKEKLDFREVMRIPSVTTGDKLATIIHPTEGIDGRDVSGKVVKARPGKPTPEKTGKNVVYKEEDHSFYATSDGQVNI